jgi:hypothetical protein
MNDKISRCTARISTGYYSFLVLATLTALLIRVLMPKKVAN